MYLCGRAGVTSVFMSSFSDRLQDALEADENVVLRAAPTEASKREFARSVLRGLASPPKWLSAQYLYDAEGSRLFVEITKQPEYYPTRTEAAILERHAGDIAAATGPVTLVELGAGTAEKTGHLLKAYAAVNDDNVNYVPIDVSESALRQADDVIREEHDDVSMTGIVGTYESVFPHLSGLSPAMVIFLGGTIGNFNVFEAGVFWRDISHYLSSGDYFLLGIDLVKDHDILNAAYNDAAGMTARFSTNLFARMNRELGSAIDLSVLEHVARFNPELSRIETRVRFNEAQDIYLEPLDETVHIDAGEEVMIEISRKFELDWFGKQLEDLGLSIREVYTDPKKWFALVLLQLD